MRVCVRTAIQVRRVKPQRKETGRHIERNERKKKPFREARTQEISKNNERKIKGKEGG
jgi:hypothetical protein